LVQSDQTYPALCRELKNLSIDGIIEIKNGTTHWFLSVEELELRIQQFIDYYEIDG